MIALKVKGALGAVPFIRSYKGIYFTIVAGVIFQLLKLITAVITIDKPKCTSPLWLLLHYFPSSHLVNDSITCPHQPLQLNQSGPSCFLTPATVPRCSTCYSSYKFRFQFLIRFDWPQMVTLWGFTLFIRCYQLGSNRAMAWNLGRCNLLFGHYPPNMNRYYSWFTPLLPHILTSAKINQHQLT